MRRLALCLLAVAACRSKPTSVPDAEPAPAHAAADLAAAPAAQSAADAPGAEERTATDSEPSGGSSAGRVEPAEVVAIKGALDKDAVRDVVRSHISQVQACYTTELDEDPALAGRVAIQFSVSPNGRVTDSVVNTTALGRRDVGDRVGTCIAAAVKGWQFPKPGGNGHAVVTYPFELVTG